MPGPDGFITRRLGPLQGRLELRRLPRRRARGGRLQHRRGGRFVGEDDGAYLELSGEHEIDSHRLRYTAGVRRIAHAIQLIDGRG